MYIVEASMSESLADYVQRIRNKKNISTLKVEEQSKGKITNSYVSKIENGYITNVSPEKLKALAKGLGVPEEEVFTVARGSKSKGSRLVEEIISYVSELSVARQKDILSFSKLFYEEVTVTEQGKSGGVTIKVPKEPEYEVNNVTKKSRKKLNING